MDLTTSEISSVHRRFYISQTQNFESPTRSTRNSLTLKADMSGFIPSFSYSLSKGLWASCLIPLEPKTTPRLATYNKNGHKVFALLPLRGRICFSIFYILIGLVLLQPKGWSKSNILSLSCKRLLTFGHDLEILPICLVNKPRLACKLIRPTHSHCSRRQTSNS